MSAPSLAAFLRSNSDEIIGRWTRKVTSRLGLESTTRPQLINHLPAFFDELVQCLEQPPDSWAASAGAVSHGEQRIAIGVDIGALAEEFGMVAETIFEIAGEHGVAIDGSQATLLMRLIARGTAVSVRAYGRLRDRQLADEAARHFSFIAHELRTPLHTARLAAELIQMDPERAPEHFEKLARAHAQVASLIDNALVEARLQGEPLLRLRQVAARDLLGEAADNARLAADRKRIAIEVDAEAIELSVDPKIMVSAVTNLLVNAVKFSREGSTVGARASVRDERVLIEVSDHCGGLPEEVVPRLFQPFVQAGKDRSGFGLGLLIVKQAVEVHDGAVRIVNAPGRGCTFVIELNLRSEPEGC